MPEESGLGVAAKRPLSSNRFNAAPTRSCKVSVPLAQTITSATHTRQQRPIMLFSTYVITAWKKVVAFRTPCGTRVRVYKSPAVTILRAHVHPDLELSEYIPESDTGYRIQPLRPARLQVFFPTAARAERSGIGLWKIVRRLVIGVHPETPPPQKRPR